jgi:hypothetical protein
MHLCPFARRPNALPQLIAFEHLRAVAARHARGRRRGDACPARYPFDK